MGDLGVVFSGELIDREEPFVSIERKMARVVVREVPRVRAVADDEQLYEAQQSLRVAVPGIVLVLDELLNCPSRTDAQRLQLDLGHGDAVDQERNVVAVVAVGGVDTKLVYDLECVL